MSISRVEPGDISLPEIVHTGSAVKPKERATFSLKKNKFAKSVLESACTQPKPITLKK